MISNGVSQVFCRSSLEQMMAATSLENKEKDGTTSAEGLRSITTGPLVDRSGATNTEVAWATPPRFRQSLVPGQHFSEEGHKSARFFARSHSSVGKPHPRTAQLTVFYAGMVNVYDEVPLDKAEAIMGLADRARTWASSNDSRVLSGSGGASKAVKCGAVPTSMVAMNPPSSRASESPSSLTAQAESVVPNVQSLRTIATKAELPQARKASLSRFLERRKERLRAGPYTSTMRSNCTASNSQSWRTPQTS